MAWICQRTRVKMCGTTRPEDARAAVICGVDALGFIFFEKSARNVAVDDARAIIETLPPFIDRVGVFVNGSVADVSYTARKAKLSYLQLHGRETPDYCRELRQHCPNERIIKVVRVGGETREEDFSPYYGLVDAFLLDTYVKGNPGGTGLTFDWSIVGRLDLKQPIILAGGLTQENVHEAITSVHPYGIDINSGVEVSPGIKDHHKLQQLMAVVATTAHSL